MLQYRASMCAIWVDADGEERDFALCPGCRFEFNDQSPPFLLQCAHSFCTSCKSICLRIEPLFVSDRLHVGLSKSVKGSATSCPLCKEETPLPDGGVKALRTNRGLLNIITASWPQRSECKNCAEPAPLYRRGTYI